MKKLVPADANLIPETAKKVFQGEIFSVHQWQQAMFDDSKATFEMLRRADTVEVICIDNDQIIVLDEEQPHTGKRTNFPCGRVDDTDTTLLEAAKRETLEEVGMQFANWKLVDVRQPVTKIEWFIYTYVATNKTSQIAPKPDVGEKIEVKHCSFEKVKQLVSEGAGDFIENQPLFKSINSLDDLLRLPEFQGTEIER